MVGDEVPPGRAVGVTTTKHYKIQPQPEGRRDEESSQAYFLKTAINHIFWFFFFLYKGALKNKKKLENK